MASPAPSPSVTPNAPQNASDSDILGANCRPGDFTCYKNQVSDNQIVTALWVSVVVGAVALLAFALLRSKVKTFHTRMLLGSVWVPPPDLPSGGIHHLWSWLIPLFRTSDAELIHTAGLDALILSWICSLGIQIFLPVSILGAVMLLPICMSGTRVSTNLSSTDPKAAASTFSKLTVSNIARGSVYYWVVFAFVYIVTAYICWLLIKYYQAYVILRQHYLLGGENLINEWHLQFLAHKEAAEKESGAAGPAQSTLATLRQIFDPSSQVAAIADDLEDAASMYSGLPLSNRMTVAGTMAQARGRKSIQEDKSIASGRRSNKSLLAAALRRRRILDRSPSPSKRAASHISPTSPVSAPSFAPPSRQAKPQAMPGRLWRSTEGPFQPDSVEVDGRIGGDTAACRPVEGGHRREGSELTREVLEAAGMAPLHDAEKARAEGEVLHEPGMVNPGGGGLRGGLRERQKGRTKQPSVDTSAGEEAQVKDRNLKSVRFLGGSFHRMKHGGFLRRGKGPSDSQELMDRSMERSTSLKGEFDPEEKPVAGASADEPQTGNGIISKYERDAPADESDRERIHQWWRPAEGADTTSRAGGIQAGKPNVSFRKIINTKLSAGDTIGVNAQCYTVLVLDVPDLKKERKRAAKRAARHRWWWRLWYRFVAWIKVRILLRQDVDRRTGDFVLPATPTIGQKVDNTDKQANPKKGSLELSSIHVDKDGHGGGGPKVWQIQEEGEPPAVEQDTFTDRSNDGQQSIKAGGDWGEKPPLYGPDSHRSLAVSIVSNPEEIGTTPRSNGTVQMAEGDDSDEDDDGEEEIDSELLVRETFKNLFPDSFDGVLPVRKHKEVDLLLAKWNTAWHKLMAAEQKYEKNGCTKRPEGKPKCCGLIGARVDLIDHWAKEIRRLEEEIVAGRQKALNSRARTSYFVFFTSQKDAAIAAQTNLHPEDGHSFRVIEAPGPEEVEVNHDNCAPQQRIFGLELCATEDTRASEIAGRLFLMQYAVNATGLAVKKRIPSALDLIEKSKSSLPVNWQTLWMTWAERDVRGVVSLIPLAVLIVFPIGLFSGAINQATVAICNGNSFLNIFYSSWYCKKSSLARSLVTGVLPSLLLMLWQNLVMPSAVYRIAQQQGASPSLSTLDRRIGTIFFVWDIFNVFLGAMLGGSIFSQLGTLIKNPGSIASSIGTALPSASNFFINFIILQAFATQTVRMLIPHLGVIPEFFRLCGCCQPKSDLQKSEALSPHSIRYGREIGAILLIFIEAMAYGATSPIILPFALIYFGAAWVHWRYNILYISERCYESGGRAWDMTFQCMVWILFIFELFTGFVLLSNSAYAQATVLWITMTPLLYKFSRYCETRYGSAVRHMPIETAAAAPLASVPAVVYMPPALRKGAAGWYPEFGKAWENFGMPAYTW